MSSPKFGAAIRHEWQLDPDFLTVNHGSFGATPCVVLAAQAEWRRRMEAQPTRFMASVLPDALRKAAALLAEFVGAKGKDIVFLDNATTGCNAVLGSLRLVAGDEVLTLDHGYGAVRNAVRHTVERVGARMTEARLPFPRPDIDTIVSNVTTALTPRTRLVVVDHITSGSGLVIPLRQIVESCHAVGVPVLVDGAHGPGQISLDLKAIGADWYIGNCHKWLCAPKGSAFLWAAPERQHDLHPVTISHGLNHGFTAEFDWTGTRDPSAYLAVETALEFHRQLGGAAFRDRNTALAADATALLARRLNTDIGAGGELAGAMGVVRLPMLEGASAERVALLRQRLLAAGTDAPVHVLAGAAWLRISAFAYNDLPDYERLGEIVADVLNRS